jgi:hypothetical protein
MAGWRTQLREVPLAAGDYASGTAGVLGAGLAQSLVLVLVLLGIGALPVLTGILVVVVAVVLPAGVGAGYLVAREKLPPLLEDRLGSVSSASEESDPFEEFAVLDESTPSVDSPASETNG